MRCRHKFPFFFLGFLFSLTKETTRRYFREIRDIYHRTCTPLLFYPQSLSTIDSNRPADFAEAFPTIRYILDGVPLQVKMAVKFALNRLSWSTYKHFNCFLFVISKYHRIFLPCCTMFNPASRLQIVISPDGLIQFRSALFGGLSAEVTTILNRSQLGDILKGMLCQTCRSLV